ncbi:hypothetical protein BC829DRAFT_47221 [Chytridium lagenaria]|nr:hypothetical protein BC829DRAFT_47221 [Chytridium lagenaria]
MVVGGAESLLKNQLRCSYRSQTMWQRSSLILFLGASPYFGRMYRIWFTLSSPSYNVHVTISLSTGCHDIHQIVNKYFDTRMLKLKEWLSVENIRQKISLESGRCMKHIMSGDIELIKEGCRSLSSLLVSMNKDEVVLFKVCQYMDQDAVSHLIVKTMREMSLDYIKGGGKNSLPEDVTLECMNTLQGLCLIDATSKNIFLKI